MFYPLIFGLYFNLQAVTEPAVDLLDGVDVDNLSAIDAEEVFWVELALEAVDSGVNNEAFALEVDSEGDAFVAVQVGNVVGQ